MKKKLSMFSATNCTENGSNVDLALILDTSGSLNYSGWAQLVSFCINLIDRLNIGPNATQVAVIVFGSNAAVNFRFGTYQSGNAVESAIRNITYSGGSTNLNDALFLLWSDVYAPDRGSRPGMSRVAVIITDGEDNENPELTLSNATICKNTAGVRLMAVGVTDKINERRLRSIASPGNENYYSVAGYEQLANITNALNSGIDICVTTAMSTTSSTTTTTTMSTSPPTITTTAGKFDNDYVLFGYQLFVNKLIN